MSERIRLDLALEQRGLLPSRARARDAILRGTVTINGVTAVKQNQMVGKDDKLELSDPAANYVSRAALKLVAGLDAGAIDPKGKICADIGSSTGGFTQVLMERGAARIYAVDVGHDQLHQRLKGSDRVVSMEGVNAKDLTAEAIAEPIALLVSDVSFVSVTKVLAAPLALCAPGADAVILFKPQFEVGRRNVGKGGIVTSQEAIDTALTEMVAFMREQGFAHRLSIPSPITGGDGNTETVAIFSKTAG
ncbi:TlyA family RNA methyltransferase [Devosia sp. J2-20]|uniref:TlyA family RNA methyltransferase n=1 Tax=Devosia litorisediminis TaxID=2829817 RepID=A0A942I5Q9_9HYPH|nr:MULTISPECIES: TlyA family RNA methyltransferase [Devosia]MBS3849291.1 TlyA family RNA methyltransferase [Devosia litorisediminis]MCZ4344707.1 TlyA family RNA methyltransferase [Devosia neptuniae]WDQ97653.1 TlyA family RNA methyltransferase [Devosia sp. J2-20]